MADVLTKIAESVRRRREGTQEILTLGGLTPPSTEQEWLLFFLNQTQRDMGNQPPLDWPDGHQGVNFTAELPEADE